MNRVVPDASDATLSSLSCYGGTLSPAFAPEVTSYTLNTEYPYSEVYALYNIDNQQWNEQLCINARVSQFNATVTVDTIDVSVDDEYNPREMILSPGNNTIAIKVTSDDGTEKTYTITANRTTSASTATGLTFSAPLTPVGGQTDIYQYEGTENYFSFSVTNPDTGGMSNTDSDLNSSDTLYLSAKREAFGQTVAVSLNGTPVTPTKTDDWQNIPLAEGLNVFHVDVTAEDGVSTRMYTLNVTNNDTWSLVFQDDFNRADSGDLGSNWSASDNGNASAEIDGNTLLLNAGIDGMTNGFVGVSSNTIFNTFSTFSGAKEFKTSLKVVPNEVLSNFLCGFMLHNLSMPYNLGIEFGFEVDSGSVIAGIWVMDGPSRVAVDTQSFAYTPGNNYYFDITHNFITGNFQFAILDQSGTPVAGMPLEWNCWMAIDEFMVNMTSSGDNDITLNIDDFQILKLQ